MFVQEINYDRRSLCLCLAVLDVWTKQSSGKVLWVRTRARGSSFPQPNTPGGKKQFSSSLLPWMKQQSIFIFLITRKCWCRKMSAWIFSALGPLVALRSPGWEDSGWSVRKAMKGKNKTSTQLKKISDLITWIHAHTTLPLTIKEKRKFTSVSHFLIGCSVTATILY